MKIFSFYPVYETNAYKPRIEYLIFDDTGYEFRDNGTVEDYIKEYIDDDSYGEVWYWEVDIVYEFKFDTLTEVRKKMTKKNKNIPIVDDSKETLKKYGYQTYGTLYSAPNEFGDKDYRDIVSIYACPFENYGDKNAENIINISTFPSPVTKEEFDKLKEDVIEMKKLLGELVEQLKKGNTSV